MSSPQKNPKIVQLIAESEGSDAAQIVSIYKQIKVLGKADKLWEMKKIPPKQVGVHKANRGGYMCSGVASHCVGETACTVGYDPDVHKDATAFENEADRSSINSFLKIQKNDEHLALYEESDIDANSVACSHFNQFLAAAIDCRPTPSLCDKIQLDGKLSKEVCCAHNPGMDDAFEGLEWCVWKSSSEVMYPKLPDFAQRALNAKYAAQQEENIFESNCYFETFNFYMRKCKF